MQRNTAQEEAIRNTEGPMIIIACPGSGKTTTLIRRISYMLEHGIDGKSILMMTFTRAAAKEMEERFKAAYGDGLGVTFSTIHAICYRVLLNYMPNTPKIISEHDTREYLINCVKRNRNINDKNEFVNDLLLDITRLKNNRIELKNFKVKCTTDKNFFDSVYLSYENFKKDNNLMDMDDLLVYAYELINTDIRILRILQERFKYIQVDEYQDTNYIQRDIIYLLAGERKNLAVVGDDDQAIYGFRGAKPEIMLDFAKDFPDAKEIFLSTNYRSSKVIVDKAKNLIRYNTLRFRKEFHNFHQENGHFEIQSAVQRTEELKMVIRKIKTLQQHGVDLGDVAILYRTNNQAMMIAEYCVKNKIPFKTTENINSKYHHWLFFDLYSYHKLATGTGTAMDWLRILNHPMRFLFGDGFIKKDMNRKKMKDYAASQTSKQLWQIENMQKEIDKLFDFLDLIKDKGPVDTIRMMNNTLHYKTYIRKYAESRNTDENTLLEIWDNYYMEARDKGGNDWSKWETYIKNFENAMNRIKKAKQGITLSTMHKAKGLEWEHVFIIDCVKNYHPYYKSSGLLEFEEERRLFYVAMTRAKRYLYLYYYERQGNRRVEETDYFNQIMR